MGGGAAAAGRGGRRRQDHQRSHIPLPGALLRLLRGEGGAGINDVYSLVGEESLKSRSWQQSAIMLVTMNSEILQPSFD